MKKLMVYLLFALVSVGSFSHAKNIQGFNTEKNEFILSADTNVNFREFSLSIDRNLTSASEIPSSIQIKCEQTISKDGVLQTELQSYLLAQSNIGQCMGACASEQGICIGHCQGNGTCISQCAATHGRCVSRCR